MTPALLLARRLWGAIVVAWAARWRPRLMRETFRAGWRTKGMMRPFTGHICEACPQGKPTVATAAFWSESAGRDVHLCEWHTLKFQAVNMNRAEGRAWRRQQRQRGGGTNGRPAA